MRIQDLISHMEIFPICIRLVTEISLDAYGHCANPRMHTGIMCHVIPYANGDLCDPHVYTGIDLDPRLHTGILCHAIPACIQGSLIPPYAYGD